MFGLFCRQAERFFFAFRFVTAPAHELECIFDDHVAGKLAIGFVYRG